MTQYRIKITVINGGTRYARGYNPIELVRSKRAGTIYPDAVVTDIADKVASDPSVSALEMVKVQ